VIGQFLDRPAEQQHDSTADRQRTQRRRDRFGVDLGVRLGPQKRDDGRTLRQGLVVLEPAVRDVVGDAQQLAQRAVANFDDLGGLAHQRQEFMEEHRRGRSDQLVRVKV
jgi:hypothetical protein